MRALLAIVIKDLKLFFNNPKAVVITMLVPIAIGSFMGSIFGSGGGGSAPRVKLYVVNHDESPVAQKIVDSIKEDGSLKAEVVTEEAAREGVRNGKVGVAVIIPDGFAKAATRTMFGPGEKPKLTLVTDPSKSTEVNIVQGLMSKNVMQIVGRETFTGAGVGEALKELANAPQNDFNKEAMEMLRSVEKFMNRPAAERAGGGAKPAGIGGGFSQPYETSVESVMRETGPKYNGYAHSFAGMAVQFVLMFAIETGILLLLDRQRGVWTRLRSAPLAKRTLLAGRAASSTVISLLTLFVCWAFCMAVFGVRVHGSMVGFLLCNVAFAIFAATVGLLLAAIGRSPEATRGMAMFAILLLVMLGGAWVPSFVFPEWLQQLTIWMPTRWAVDGFDGATWRGLSFMASLTPVAVLLGYAVCFGLLALWKFKWEER